MLPAKEGGEGEKGIKWEFVMKGSSVRPLRHMPTPRKAIAVPLLFAQGIFGQAHRAKADGSGEGTNRFART